MIWNDEQHQWVKHRPDPSDLTQRLWCIKRAAWMTDSQWKDMNRLSWMSWFFGFWTACLIIIAYWLGKQAGLWG